ncbi:MAG: hypothetical protein KIS77_09880 [Saprospiraceae bacterium]|nr:hypothetical protein [Saprospiraceae bacterium]
MKHIILFSLMFACLNMAVAQKASLRLLPEAGLSYPLGDFKSQNVYAAKGYQFGGHLDLMWGNFGLGLYGGMDKNNIQYEDLLPASNSGLSIVKTADIEQGYWRQLAAGLGPVLRLNLSKRLNFELSSKAGVAQIAYPNYSQLVNIGTPPVQEFTLYQTNNEAVAKQFNPMLLSAGRLNIGLARNIDLSLSGNFRHVRDVRHAYRFLDGDFSPNMTNEALLEALRTAPTVAEVRKCHFNSVGVTVGLGIIFGGKKDRPDEVKIAPPVPEYPEDGATISTEEADSLVLQWQREKPETAKANYNLWLYKVAESGRGADSLILKTKTQRKNLLALPQSVRLEPDQTYKWRVQAVDDNKLKPCPGDCYSLYATFQVGGDESVYYYELLTKDAGNYVEAKGQLRVNLPKNLYLQGKVGGSIFNAKNEEVLKVENLLPGNRSAFHTTDEQGRVAFSLRGLPVGYYRLEVQDEQHRRYFLRFKIGKSTAHEKD